MRIAHATLEEKARNLEQGNLPLEESLKLYEEGAVGDRTRGIPREGRAAGENLQGRMDGKTSSSPARSRCGYEADE
ncbi:MAG: exodeoxyribonuclease VII small subunit [Dehalococcoidia bacterium]|nr:exodeoxyribonuclease VII small subunit [Dehalococcoidia bacterium]